MLETEKFFPSLFTINIDELKLFIKAKKDKAANIKIDSKYFLSPKKKYAKSSALYTKINEINTCEKTPNKNADETISF